MTLLKPIARGGMGEVFLAASGGIEGAERPCVVKVIRRDHAQDQSFLARFFDEARVQAQLHHPGVAQVLEASTDPKGMPYVVVEFVEGRNLGEVRNRSSQLKAPLSWADATAIAISIAEALVHVHERTDSAGRPLDIVHRDLSPQNVMLGYAGDVKLIDFGTARGENRRCHTVNGIVFAKPGYVAPEVANNQPGGIPADLYALGIILWELIAGRRFLSGDAKEHLAAVAGGTRNPPPIAAFMDIPLELDTIIARLTAPKIEDRFSAAREVVQHLVRMLKRAPTLANGERSVRSRIAQVMGRLYPSEPARTRSEFAALLAATQSKTSPAQQIPNSPLPGATGREDLFPGTRYRLLREISKSDMGVVHEALHIDLGRRVALKVLPRERCENPEFEARFRSEARSLAGVRHGNLVQLHDFGVSSDGRPFYAMELLEGETLAKYLEREKGMDWREALKTGVQACDALIAAHDAGVVHRDIKPANLFLTKDGGVKLIDFGIAKLGSESAKDSEGDAVHVLGTPEYMAPEQINSADVDARADVYALGTVLYELVTGVLPFDAVSTVALLEKKLSSPAEVPSRRAPQKGIPRCVDRVLLRSLAPSPDGRLGSAKAFKQALEQALGAPGAGRTSRRRLVYASSAVAAAAALAVLAPTLTSLGSELVTAVQALNPPSLGAPSTTVAVSVPPELLEQRPSFELREELAVAPSDAAPVAISEHTVELPASAFEDSAPSTQPDAPADDTSAVEGDEEGAAAPPIAHRQEEPAETEPDSSEDPDLNRRLASAEAEFQRKRYVVSLATYRRLGTDYPMVPKVLEGWSRAARKTKGWGESLRVAEMWAKIDESSNAQLHLARVQRAVGKRHGAITTLEQLLAKQPDNEQARSLLESYGGKALATNEQSPLHQ